MKPTQHAKPMKLMKAYVVGVGMTKFEKPETRDWQYWDMAEEAGTAALADASSRTVRSSRPSSATASSPPP